VKPDRTVVVVGHGGDRVSAKVSEQVPDWAHVNFVEQAQQNGTGHAALIGLTALPGDELDDTSTVIVLPGDTPLLRTETIEALVNAHESSGNAATVLTAVVESPTGYGRIVRARDGRVMKIVEQRDAVTEE
jgi:bifunctional UDP-N-acetylglucosamine pyrophosphorylase/glucosamine-1-phosphate N-acetyltransferase